MKTVQFLAHYRYRVNAIGNEKRSAEPGEIHELRDDLADILCAWKVCKSLEPSQAPEQEPEQEPDSVADEVAETKTETDGE